MSEKGFVFSKAMKKLPFWNHKRLDRAGKATKTLDTSMF